MNNYNKNSTALKLVQQENQEPKKRKQKASRDIALADVRMDLRAEAKMLTITGRCLLILGVIVSALLCTVNGYIFHTLVNDVGLAYANVDPATAIAVFISLGVGGLLFAGVCVFLALVLFGVADTLRQEAKKIKQA